MSDLNSNHDTSRELSASPPPTTDIHALGRVSLAAFVVSIVALMLAIIPGASFIAFLPAIVGGVLGIIALARRRARRKMAMAAVVLAPLALLLAIIVSIATIALGAASGIAHSVSDRAPATISSVEPSAEPAATSTPEDTSTPAPAVAPVVPAVPADTTYNGSGDSVIAVVLPDGAGQPSVATITHTGSSNFTVWTLDSAATQQDLLVNVIGNYAGTVPVDFRSGQTTVSLEIGATGPWTVTFHSLKALREFAGPNVTGTGDDVVVYRGKAGAAAITNAGSGNFTVWQYGSSSNLAVNEIGAYTGTVRWMAGNSVVAVGSTGAWSIQIQ